MVADNNWIWDIENCEQRNKRICFRKTFSLVDTENTSLHITADSRYILYVNGVKVGFGPSRYWDFLQSYDTYDISDYLNVGNNVIAVLACHFGISTFQYIHAKAGLLINLEQNYKLLFTSNSLFKCKEHLGYDKRVLLMAVQQAFAEIYDANFLDNNWTTADFDDLAWQNCVMFSKETELIPRDIPFLTSETI